MDSSHPQVRKQADHINCLDTLLTPKMSKYTQDIYLKTKQNIVWCGSAFSRLISTPLPSTLILYDSNCQALTY